MSIPEGKLGLFWIFGALALTSAGWILGLENLASSHIFFSIILILFAGLSWIGVAVGVIHKNKRK